MRLIDADALNKKLCKITTFIKDGEKFQRMINEAPTIEPDGDTISRSQAIKDVSEWATDILHPDRLVKEDAIHILESLPSAEQSTCKLKNPCDSLLAADSEACKEQKSKLDLISRQALMKRISEEYHKYGDDYDALQILGDIEDFPSAETSTNTSTNTSTDLISRQDAIKTVKELNRKINEGTGLDTVCTSDVLRRIDALPSAPDSRQRGEWIAEIGYDGEVIYYECPQCGDAFTLIDGTPEDNNYNFCPNCGADMRGDSE